MFHFIQRLSQASPKLPACSLGKQSRTAQSLGILHLPGIHQRSSWLWIGSALAIVTTWGVKQQMEDFSVSTPLCKSAFPMKMLKYTFTLGVGASRKIEKLALKSSLQQNFSSLFSRSWCVSSSFPVYINKTHCYHTSPCSFKKEKQAVLSPRPPSTIAYLTDSPKPALYITLAGLIPFVAPPLVMVMTKTYIPILALTQMAYGASFLSFLGGVRWGFALPQDSPAKPDFLNLANSMGPVVFSWLAFLTFERLNVAIVTVMIGLGMALHAELFLLPHYPKWFRALRLLVTLVAFLSFSITLVVENIYPEKGPKRAG